MFYWKVMYLGRYIETLRIVLDLLLAFKSWIFALVVLKEISGKIYEIRFCIKTFILFMSHPLKFLEIELFYRNDWSAVSNIFLALK